VPLRAAARLALGLGLSALGFAALLGVGFSLWLPLVVGGLAVSGVGSGLINSSITHLAIESVPAHRVSMGSGANNTARYIGSSLGAAGIAAVVGSLGPAQGAAVAVAGCVVLTGVTALAALLVRA
jgi:hypothetical protein